MNGVLEKIVSRIRAEEAEAFLRFDPRSHVLAKRNPPLDVPSLMKGRFFLIAEVKRASPSQGIILDLDADPVAIAQKYTQGGAAAISVVTEKYFFHGSPKDLTLIRQAVDLPILRKDFLIHPRQVYESFDMGADMVLLIAACLADSELRELHALSRSLGMTPLIEIHDEAELQRALALDPSIIGINNRNLRDLHVDTGTSFRLKEKIPSHIRVISESGIRHAQQVRQLKDAGFSGVLIGGHLLKHPDPAQAIAELNLV